MKDVIIPETQIPNSLTQIFTITKYTLLDYIRSRRFYILLAITLSVGALLTGVVAYFQPQTFLSSEMAFYSGWWGNTAVYIVALSGIFFGGDAIAGEFQNKTGYFSVPNPVKRSSIYVGKLLSAFIASTLIIGAFTALTLCNGLYYFGAAVPIEFFQSVLFSWFYLFAVLGVTFMLSSLFKSGAYAILVSAILFLFAFDLVQVIIVQLVQIEPWFLLSYGSAIISNALTIPYPQHTTAFDVGFGETLTVYNATIPQGLIIIAAYFAIAAIAGLLLFKRKEFN
ncbi:MAG: ABC transporter permease [Candidatus Bathyarchaeota archaeon]|nr:ABC transporter permease [Candidatus Bathyarchaeota archaeon]